MIPGRMTEGITGALLKLEAKRAIGPLIIIAVGFAVTIAAGLYMMTKIGGGVGETREMTFRVSDATGVIPKRAEVRFYGIPAGQVSDVELKDGKAIITATVAKKFGPVYQNATAAVRPNTALQDMYVDILDRGTSQAREVESDTVVPAKNPVNLAEVLDTFQPDVRAQLNNLLDNLGNGLDDRGADLRRAFALLTPFLQNAGKVTDQLAVRSRLTKQLVHNASVLSGTLASRSTDLRRLVTSGTQTLEALAVNNGDSLRRAFNELPRVLYTADAIDSGLAKLSPKVVETINALRPVLDELPDGLRDLRALSASASPAISKLRSPVRRLVPLSQQLRPFSKHLATSLERIAPQVKHLDTATEDASGCMNDINRFWVWDLSMSKFADNYGPFVRGNVHAGIYSLPGGAEQPNYTYRKFQCAGGKPIAGEPVPRYPGPSPTP